MEQRKKTRQVKVGGVRIGGNAPISIQSMTKSDTRDIPKTIKEIGALEKAGCEIVRVAVKDKEAAEAIREIKKRMKVPLVADIHFNYNLALLAIKNGADKIRLNPGNIYKREELEAVVKAAKKRKIPIRVGVNSGSVSGLRSQVSGLKRNEIADLLVKSAVDYIRLLEKMDFYDIVVSLKASDTLTTIEAYRKISKRIDYPLHLGVTAAGPVESGLVKSSIGIGILLLEGIGDTIRVSLTGNSCDEVIAARNILSALRLRNFGPDIISCPTCGRCQVDLRKIITEIGSRVKAQGSRHKFTLHPSPFTQMFKIAVMGCEVNGPGEARDADIGVACGKGYGAIFKDGRIIKRVEESKIAEQLIRLCAGQNILSQL